MAKNQIWLLNSDWLEINGESVIGAKASAYFLTEDYRLYCAAENLNSCLSHLDDLLIISALYRKNGRTWDDYREFKRQVQAELKWLVRVE